jgi:hypothetical protein
MGKIDVIETIIKITIQSLWIEEMKSKIEDTLENHIIIYNYVVANIDEPVSRESIKKILRKWEK